MPRLLFGPKVLDVSQHFGLHNRFDSPVQRDVQMLVVAIEKLELLVRLCGDKFSFLPRLNGFCRYADRIGDENLKCSVTRTILSIGFLASLDNLDHVIVQLFVINVLLVGIIVHGASYFAVLR